MGRKNGSLLHPIRGGDFEMDKIKIIQFWQGEILLFPMESHILSICNRILYGMKMGGQTWNINHYQSELIILKNW